MRINSIQIHNFKRFTNLLITDIPSTAKLVVVVGPNGCGKSSLFDAFLNWWRWRLRQHFIRDDDYFLKDAATAGGDRNATQRAVELTTSGTIPERNAFSVRTAHRNDPDFSQRDLARPVDQDTETLGRRLIDDDKSVASNYRRLVYSTASAVYDPANDDMQVRELREKLIGAVRHSMFNVFGDLVLQNIADPFGTETNSGSFYFAKGTATSYHFKNLSGGEKAAFDILLDMHLKKDSHQNAVFCIDELESHLHTAIQGSLVEEIVNIIPENGQLWLTTHSLGVLRAAQRLEAKEPSSTCIIDFGSANLDETCTLRPASLDRLAWEKMLSVALHDLSDLVAPDSLVICEGSQIGNRRRDFDADIYNQVLGAHERKTVFASGGSKDDVLKNSEVVKSILKAAIPGSSVYALRDRDDMSQQDIDALPSNTIALSKRNIESYLLDDEILTLYLEKNGHASRVQDVLQIKQAALQSNPRRGKPSDDLKSAAPNIYAEMKKALQLQQTGDSSDSFMKFELAPLIAPGTSTYAELKADVIDKIT